MNYLISVCSRHARTLTLFVLLAYVPQSSYSQKTHISNVGINLGWIATNNLGETALPGVFYAGLFTQLNLNRNYSLSAETNYQQFVYEAPLKRSSTETSTTLSYIEQGLLFQLQKGASTFSIGPKASVLVRQKNSPYAYDLDQSLKGSFRTAVYSGIFYYDVFLFPGASFFAGYEHVFTDHVVNNNKRGNPIPEDKFSRNTFRIGTRLSIIPNKKKIALRKFEEPISINPGTQANEYFIGALETKAKITINRTNEPKCFVRSAFKNVPLHTILDSVYGCGGLKAQLIKGEIYLITDIVNHPLMQRPVTFDIENGNLLDILASMQFQTKSCWLNTVERYGYPTLTIKCKNTPMIKVLEALRQLNLITYTYGGLDILKTDSPKYYNLDPAGNLKIYIDDTQ